MTDFWDLIPVALAAAMLAAICYEWMRGEK